MTNPTVYFVSYFSISMTVFQALTSAVAVIIYICRGRLRLENRHPRVSKIFVLYLPISYIILNPIVYVITYDVSGVKSHAILASGIFIVLALGAVIAFMNEKIIIRPRPFWHWSRFREHRSRLYEWYKVYTSTLSDNKDSVCFIPPLDYRTDKLAEDFFSERQFLEWNNFVTGENEKNKTELGPEIQGTQFIIITWYLRPSANPSGYKSDKELIKKMSPLLLKFKFLTKSNKLVIFRCFIIEKSSLESRDYMKFLIDILNNYMVDKKITKKNRILTFNQNYIVSFVNKDSTLNGLENIALFSKKAVTPADVTSTLAGKEDVLPNGSKYDVLQYSKNASVGGNRTMLLLLWTKSKHTIKKEFKYFNEKLLGKEGIDISQYIDEYWGKQ